MQQTYLILRITSMTQLNIPQVIDKILAGSIDDYHIIVERYHTGLIIYCERLTGDRDVAEDLAQQAFIRAYDKLKQFDTTKASFSTWLYRIARNLCIDHLRQQHQYSNFDIDELPDTSGSGDLPYDEVESIRRAVDNLEPPVYAEAVKAYYWQGKSYKEIADTHHTSVSTVASWIRRAKATLRKELA